MTTPTPSGSASPPARAVVTAWQAALAAEHRACFGYPYLGPHLVAARQQTARTDQAAHEALRDATVSALTAAGQVPVAPLADYPLGSVADAAAAVRLAATLEDDCAEAWRYLYAQAATTGSTTAGSATTGSATAGSAPIRASAQTALTASAVRAALWRSTLDAATATEPFPGL